MTILVIICFYCPQSKLHTQQISDPQIEPLLRYRPPNLRKMQKLTREGTKPFQVQILKSIYLRKYLELRSNVLHMFITYMKLYIWYKFKANRRWSPERHLVIWHGMTHYPYSYLHIQIKKEKCYIQVYMQF